MISNEEIEAVIEGAVALANQSNEVELGWFLRGVLDALVAGDAAGLYVDDYGAGRQALTGMKAGPYASSNCNVSGGTPEYEAMVELCGRLLAEDYPQRVRLAYAFQGVLHALAGQPPDTMRYSASAAERYMVGYTRTAVYLDGLTA